MDNDVTFTDKYLKYKSKYNEYKQIGNKGSSGSKGSPSKGSPSKGKDKGHKDKDHKDKGHKDKGHKDKGHKDKDHKKKHESLIDLSQTIEKKEDYTINNIFAIITFTGLLTGAFYGIKYNIYPVIQKYAIKIFNK